MTEREQENRVMALGHAVRHKRQVESAKDVVKSAEEYFDFLQGDKTENE